MTEPRTLRSKALRALLWLAAHGKCQRCGIALGDDWQAYHVVPWVVSKRTNVHEMQALCAVCNRTKGSTMYRKHQQEADDLFKKISAGSMIDRVFVSVTPGGGKSLLPVIAAHRLIPNFADAILWVVPRQSLQEQGERGFGEFRQLVGHRHEIRISTNQVNPTRGTSGYVTTYQAIQVDAGINADEVSRRRYILVLDEPHHIAEGSSLHRAIAPLVARAKLTIFMSGTWERHDGRPIAFVPYYATDGGYRLDLPNFSDEMEEVGYAALTYSRRDALREKAIKPLRFMPIDGETKFTDRDGETRFVPSIAESDQDVADAIYSALNTDYADQLLDKCVSDWRAYRTIKRHSKLLIVAANISSAKKYVKRVRALGVDRVEIATSDDTQSARDAIKRYKRRTDDASALDAIVTVAMAYEGLDVPAITHVACLTHIRSRPWIEQMATRAARVCKDAGPYEEQIGFIYGPDDRLLRDCFDAILREQEPFVKEQLERQMRASLDTDDGETPEVKTILPMSGAVTRERVIDLATGESLNFEETARITFALQQHGATGIMDPLTFKRIMDTLETNLRPVVEPPMATTPSEREQRLREGINSFTRRYEGSHGVEYGSLNKAIVRTFQKKRDDMTETELQQVWTWLQNNYSTAQ